MGTACDEFFQLLGGPVLVAIPFQIEEALVAGFRQRVFPEGKLKGAFLSDDSAIKLERRHRFASARQAGQATCRIIIESCIASLTQSHLARRRARWQDSQATIH